jgi:ABC-type sugar transport system ATPase subunit
MASVAFEHVEKVYPNGAHAVHDCSLGIADGELMVLVGPSGCGKTTLLRMIAGLEEVTSGTLRIGERVVNDLSPQQRNIAMVFQDYALYPHMTVRGNLEFPLKMRRLARAEIGRRVEWAAGLLDIAAVLDQLPKQLSGGQRQRVAMGRALVREPAVFLLDEPLSNLDAKLRVQVRAEIADLQRRMQATMIYVTHDQTEAMTLGDRVAVLNNGALQQVATPHEVYERPANVFVAGFIGNPPMNLFPTRLSAQGDAVCLAIGDQDLPLGSRPVPAAGSGELTAGVRPEAFRFAPGAGEPAVRAVVEHVEWLGHETLAYVRAGEVRLIARLPGMHRLAKGEGVRLGVEPRSFYLFGAHGGAL